MNPTTSLQCACRYMICLQLLLAVTHMNAQQQDNGTSSFMVTEICVANIDQTVDYSYNYGGWIELYNPTSTDISLNGLYISDDEKMLRKHKLTGFGNLNSGSYQCIFFDHNAADGEYGADAVKQVGFKLNREGGILYLSRNGIDVDLSIAYPHSVPRCSYARVNLESDEWQFCGTPTPGHPNTGGFAHESLPEPEVDCDSKLFTDEFTLQATIPSGCTLRYTVDGSTPTLTNGKTSNNGRFTITQTTVLRFRLFAEGYLPSGIVTRTFILKDREYYLPIVAISTDPRNFYDEQIGCYVNGKNGIIARGSKVKSNLNMDWSRPVNFEYLSADGEMTINQEACFEVTGGYSRHFEPASFKLQAKKLYDGNGTFDYPLFRRKPYCKYKQLIIRNGGNNNRTDGGPRIKDAITQQVLTSSGYYVDAQEYQPVHVFINGKYLAMMNVREPNNRFHGSANYGYDDDEIDGFEYSSGLYRQRGGDKEAFDHLIKLSANAGTENGYERIREVLDIEEFVRYMATICYTGSYDWLLNANNVKGYRSKENGKFHFVLFDQDLTWERTNNVETIDGITTNEVLIIYNNLKRNKDFRKQFVTSYCILHGSIYTPERCKSVADSICELINVALSFDRRNTTSTYKKLKNEMWGDTYREARIKSLMKAYNLTDGLEVSVCTENATSRILMNGQSLPYNRFSGVLFGGEKIAAESANGYRFLGWKNQEGEWISHNKELSVTESGKYVAAFDKVFDEGTSPICFNEVSAANDIYVNDYGKRADWIELYNRGPMPVDVSQWFFSENDNNQTKYQIGVADGTSTIIPPNGHLVVWCDGRVPLHGAHLPFKLENADSTSLVLESPDGLWKDSIRYDMHSSRESVGRWPDGGNNLRTFYHPTICNHNMPTNYDHIIEHAYNDAMPPASLSDEIMDVTYYTISGIKVQKPVKGLYIKSVNYKNGKRQQYKIFQQ